MSPRPSTAPPQGKDAQLKAVATSPVVQQREQSEFFARNALSRMAVLGIPPTPQNFLVWYGYFSGQPAELKAAVDALIDGGRKADATLSDEVHRRFFGHEADAAKVAQASQAVDTLLGRLVDRVVTHDRSTAAFGGALANVKSGMGEGEIGGILARLIEETHRMVELNQEMQAHLKAAGSRSTGCARVWARRASRRRPTASPASPIASASTWLSARRLSRRVKNANRSRF